MPAQHFQLMIILVPVGSLEHTLIMDRGSKIRILRTIIPYFQNTLTRNLFQITWGWGEKGIHRSFNPGTILHNSHSLHCFSKAQGHWCCKALSSGHDSSHCLHQSSWDYLQTTFKIQSADCWPSLLQRGDGRVTIPSPDTPDTTSCTSPC